jgi:hypothetical protein
MVNLKVNFKRVAKKLSWIAYRTRNKRSRRLAQNRRIALLAKSMLCETRQEIAEALIAVC